MVYTTITCECPVCSDFISTRMVTDSVGVTVTETVQVVVTTNAEGEIYSSESSISSDVASTVVGIVTEYVTTCVGTLANGSVVTSTANVVVGTDNYGNTVLASSIVEIRNLSGQVSCYTTTKIETSNNVAFTSTYEVIVPSNSDGSRFTTSLPVVDLPGSSESESVSVGANLIALLGTTGFDVSTTVAGILTSTSNGATTATTISIGGTAPPNAVSISSSENGSSSLRAREVVITMIFSICTCFIMFG